MKEPITSFLPITSSLDSYKVFQDIMQVTAKFYIRSLKHRFFIIFQKNISTILLADSVKNFNLHRRGYRISAIPVT